MSTLRPRTPCSIRRQTTSYDGHGRRQHSATAKSTKCAVIWVKDEGDTTSVRADSSASRGAAEESVYDVRVLFKPKEEIQTGDVVKVQLKGGDPIQIEVMSVWRRPDVNGKIHHIQVEGNRWASA